MDSTLAPTADTLEPRTRQPYDYRLRDDFHDPTGAASPASVT